MMEQDVSKCIDLFSNHLHIVDELGMQLSYFFFFFFF